MFSLGTPAQVKKEPAHLIEPTCPPADALKFETFHIFQNNVQVCVRADGVNVLHDVLVLPQILVIPGHCWPGPCARVVKEEIALPFWWGKLILKLIISWQLSESKNSNGKHKAILESDLGTSAIFQKVKSNHVKSF